MDRREDPARLHLTLPEARHGLKPWMQSEATMTCTPCMTTTWPFLTSSFHCFHSMSPRHPAYLEVASKFRGVRPTKFLPVAGPTEASHGPIPQPRPLPDQADRRRGPNSSPALVEHPSEWSGCHGVGDIILARAGGTRIVRQRVVVRCSRLFELAHASRRCKTVWAEGWPCTDVWYIGRVR